MDLPRRARGAAPAEKHPHRRWSYLCAGVLSLALIADSAAASAGAVQIAPSAQVVRQPPDSSGPGTSEAMKAAMRRAIPAGGAAMGEGFPQKTASEASAAPYRAQADEGSARMTAEAYDPSHWRPSFGVAGQDVSAHQGTVDWQGQWNQGSRFAYVKASEGNYYLNERFPQQYNGSRNVGMIRGSYHFAIPNWSSGADQARYFVANGGAWTADGSTLPPVLDIEYNPYAGRTIDGFYFGDTCYNMAGAKMVAWIAEFGNTVRSLTGRYPVIYSTTDWWKRCTGSSAGFGKYPLWIAAYPSSPTSSPGALPPGWSNYSFWQYSSTGPFAGDSNIWNGDLASLRRFASVADATVPTPSIPSEADVVAADGAGVLWVYPATGNGALASRRQIGQGWTGLRSVNAVDWNSDNVLDVVAQWKTGKVNVYLGMPGGGFDAGPVLASAGWAGYQLSIGHWITGSRYPQIVTRDSAGVLRLWSNNSGAGLGGSTQIGQGWANLNLTMVDFSGDGHQDILAQDAGGALKLFRSNGTGGFISESRPTVGNGWNAMTSISVSNGYTGYGSVGLMARAADGSLRHYPLTGTGAWGQAFDVGSGWNGYLIAGGEDINLTPAQPTPPPAEATPSIRSASDLVTVDTAGNLNRQAAANGSLGAATRIGTGFTDAKSVHVTDWTADNVHDLLVQWKDGRLDVYSGLPEGGFAPSVTLAVSGWSGSDITVGRWIRSSAYPGIIARQPDGTLTYHGALASGGLDTARTVGTGFVRMHPVMADYDGDGNQDIGVIDYVGQFSVYRSAGAGTFIAEARRVVGKGWAAVTSVSAHTGFASAGATGLMARNSAGDLRHYPVERMAFGTAQTVSAGWNGSLIAGSAMITRTAPLTGPADVVTADAAGRLWNYPATGAAGLGSRYQIGTGWTGLKSLHVADWDADGISDVVSQSTSGAVKVYLGSGTGGFARTITPAGAGWSGITFITGHWERGSRHPGLVGKDTAGNLYYWANPNGTALAAARRIGTGWNGLRIAMTDFDSDGNQDLLAANTAGYMRLFRSGGAGTFLSEARKTVGAGWGSVPHFSGKTDYAGTGSKGILGVLASGQVRYYPITGGSWGTPVSGGETIAGHPISY